MEAGKEALRSGDATAIRRALDELNTAYSAAGASLYQASSTPGSEGGGGGEAPGGGPGEPAPTGKAGGDDVVDADYEIVDEKK